MRYIKNLLLAAAALLTVSSCVSEVDDVFDKASSQRIEEAMAADKAVLVGQQNGWVLKIYGNLDFGGYNVLLKFNEDNSLSVVSESYYGGIGENNYGQSDRYEVDMAHYKLEQSSGVVLSFDQYSKNLHFFSDPANPAGMGENYRGFYADLEFRVLSASPDSVVLEGKKHGRHLVMLPAPVGESGWQGYLDQVRQVDADMKSANYTLSIGGETYPARISYRNISVTVPGDEGNEYYEIPFTVTPEGYDFFEPVTIKGKTLTGFKYVAGALDYPEFSNSDVVLTSIVPPINQQFVSTVWFTSMSNLGAFGQSYWNYCNSRVMPVINNAGYAGTLDYFYFGLEDGDFGAIYKIIGYWGVNGFDYKLIGDDEISLTYNSAKNNPNYNGNTFAGSGFLYVAAYLMAPFGCDQQGAAVTRTFKITCDNLKSPNWVLLTDKNDPDNTIRMTSAEISGSLFTK